MKKPLRVGRAIDHPKAGQVLELLCEMPRALSAVEIAECTDSSLRAIRTLLGRLQRAGLVQQGATADCRAVRYRVTSAVGVTVHDCLTLQVDRDGYVPGLREKQR